jgi:hypothetical protein
VLAGSGQCESLEDLRKLLKREGYSSIDEHLAGPSLRLQLKSLISAAPAQQARKA